jgi:hypothetical protein
MRVEPDAPPVTSAPNAGCRSSAVSHLNPTILYDPRLPCAQGTFFWGIVYPIVLAFLIYTAVMIAVFIVASLLRREPSALIDQAAFAQVVSVALTGGRLLLGALIILRRTKDLGWSWLIALAWIAVAIVSLLPISPLLGWVLGAAQVVVLIVLIVLPGKIARAGKA